MRLVRNSCSKVKFAIEKEECPKTIKLQRLIFPMEQRSPLERRSISHIVSVNLAIAEVSDQQDLVIKLTKMLVLRHPRQAPGRVQQSSCDQAFQQDAFRCKHINEAVTRPSHVIMLFGVLRSEGHVKQSVDVRDAEWSPSRGAIGH